MLFEFLFYSILYLDIGKGGLPFNLCEHVPGLDSYSGGELHFVLPCWCPIAG